MDKKIKNKIVKLNTPSENVINTLKGKKVLFIENDNSLDNGLDEFERILKSAGIEYKVLFRVDELSMDIIAKEIKEHDAIVFMTQWVYDIAKNILEFMRSLKDKKIVIECYISEPTWYYTKNHGTKHELYIYKCMVHWGEPDKETERFYKISNKPYWDYKNKFDK